MRFLFVLAVMLVSASVHARDLEEETKAYDAKIRAELEALEPKALAAWDVAAKARAAHDDAAAAAAYRNVVELAPTFTHGHRRLCSHLVDTKAFDEGIAECRKAVAVADLPENASGLAWALAVAWRASPSSPAAMRDEVIALFRRWKKRPLDYATTLAFCDAEFRAMEADELRDCVGRLDELDPGAVATSYFGAVSSAMDERWGDARARVDRARAAGLPAATADGIDKLIDQNVPFTSSKTFHLLLLAFSAWFILFALLLLAGVTLSRLTFAAASRGPANVAENAGPTEHRLRRLYAGVIALTGVFFFLSYPIVLLGVLGVAGALLYGIFMVGHIPVKLVIVIIALTVATVWAMLASLFVRTSEEDPGTPLPLEQHPRLRDTLAEVASKIGTRGVDKVYVTPNTDLAVMERKKGSERCLILGIGVLEGMSLLELKSILGHEHGHFKNADTAGGQLAFSVRRRLLALRLGIARGGGAAWYNPAWLFVRGFWSTFFRISQGATRLQEVLADRWAATAYGSAAFERGLRHVVARSVVFVQRAQATIGQVIEANQPLANLYQHEPTLDDDAKADIEAHTREALGRKPGELDSHPPPELRMEWVRALAIPEPPGEPQGLAWDLFADRDALEAEMTDVVRRAVANKHAIFIPKESKESKESKDAKEADAENG